jgi:hypothetical protein
MEVEEDHPGLVITKLMLYLKISFFIMFIFLQKIILYSETNGILYILQSCTETLTKLVSTSKDTKLTSRFIGAVSALKNKGYTTTVMRFLPGILTLYVNNNSSNNNNDLNSCLSVIIYCCAFGLTPGFKDVILSSWASVLETHFSFKSNRFFDLASLLGSNKCPRWQVKKWLRLNLIPLLEDHVRTCENKRGSGTDMSLRIKIEKLQRDTIGFDLLTK